MSEQERDETLLTGLVVKAQSGFFTVQTGQGRIVCRVRGRLLRKNLRTDPVAIGDRVKISIQPDGSGMIEEVAERERAFTRQKPPPEGRRADRLPDREEVIIANPDQVVFVFACAEPAPRFRMLDRFLVIAEKAQIPAIICANKIDLVRRREAKEMFDLYDAIGYPVIYTSATKKIGIKQLREALTGKISALTGPSGVGKSSLLNAMQPGLGLAVKAVSQATAKGRHTTVAPELFPLEGGGYVADTPGIRAIGLYNIEPSELDGYFPDIRPYVGQCRFNDCRHENEPGCAVRAAVERGDIWWERYESYLRLREEAEEIYYRC
ncbi:MAG TPA: ribosome small subunit-dependent GTPase A [Chloroflexi bacterium]|nr:ribosome small subunit-dependent GTPase A [Chloroflexota bacterium]